jgi:hypothetical protein
MKEYLDDYYAVLEEMKTAAVNEERDEDNGLDVPADVSKAFNVAWRKLDELEDDIRFLAIRVKKANLKSFDVDKCIKGLRTASAVLEHFSLSYEKE